MAQRAHIDIGGDAVELTAGLDTGCYIAQVRATAETVDVPRLLYATAETAPADDGDWFEASLGQFFRFTKSAALPATWAKSGAPSPCSVALARDPQ